MEKLPTSPSRAPGRAELVWRTVLGALVAALAISAVVPACSTQQCKDMKGSGSVFGAALCGAQGDDAPEATNANQPNYCSNVRAVMPAFFALLERQDQPLAGLRAAVKELGQTQCLQSVEQRKCSGTGVCEIGDCVDGLCPCTQGYNPLADILVVTFRGLATISHDPDETSTARCAGTAEAAQLPPSKLNRMCEVRRLLDVLLQENGGNKVLDDPAVTSVLLALLDYIQGKGYASAHYDLFTTLGKMAANPSICSPATTYDLLDKLLGWLSPANAVPVLDHLSTLLADPTTQGFLQNVSGGGQSGRSAVITIAQSLLPSLTSAQYGEDAMTSVNSLVKSLIYDSTSYPQSFKDEVRAVLTDVNGLLCGDPADTACVPLHDDGTRGLGLWDPLKATLTCASNPNVDPDGQLIGAIYDLMSLKPLQPGVPGVDLPTLLNALKALAQLDPTGQVGRTGQLIVRGLENDEGATEAVRQLLAEMLTAEVGQKLIPPLEIMIQQQILGEVFTLLDDLLYQCKPPTTP